MTLEITRRPDGGRSNLWLPTRETVAEYQQGLMLVGFPLHFVGGADGDYGNFTARATGDLQGMCTWPDRNGRLLSVDGDAGPITVEMLNVIIDNGRRIAPDYSVTDFACKCRFPWPDTDRVIVTAMQRVYAHTGIKPDPLSGHRTDPHNAAVNGSAGSHHKCHPAGVEVHTWCDTSAVDLGNWRDLKLTETFCREVLGLTGGIGWAWHHGDGRWYALHIDNRPVQADWYYPR